MTETIIFALQYVNIFINSLRNSIIHTRTINEYLFYNIFSITLIMAE